MTRTWWAAPMSWRPGLSGALGSGQLAYFVSSCCCVSRLLRCASLVLVGSWRSQYTAPFHFEPSPCWVPSKVMTSDALCPETRRQRRGPPYRWPGPFSAVRVPCRPVPSSRLLALTVNVPPPGRPTPEAPTSCAGATLRPETLRPNGVDGAPTTKVVNVCPAATGNE